MSIQHLANVWTHGPENKSQLLVLMALADFSDGDGYSWPSLGKIAERSRTGRSQLIVILKQLHKDGWIDVIPRHTETGRQTSNAYQINDEKLRGPKIGLTRGGGSENRTGEGPKTEPHRGSENRTPSIRPERTKARAKAPRPSGNTPLGRQNRLNQIRKITEQTAQAVCASLHPQQVEFLQLGKDVVINGQFVKYNSHEHAILCKVLRKGAKDAV